LEYLVALHNKVIVKGKHKGEIEYFTALAPLMLLFRNLIYTFERYLRYFGMFKET
jgi:hypothetical protein